MQTQEIFAPEPQSAFDLGQQTQNAIGFPQSLDERYQPRKLEDFIGLDRPKTLIRNLIAKPRPCNLIFVGPPGAGKTVMALALAELLPASLHHVSSQKCDVAALDALNEKLAYCPPVRLCERCQMRLTPIEARYSRKYCQPRLPNSVGAFSICLRVNPIFSSIP